MPMQWRVLVVEDDETIAGQIVQRSQSGKLLPEVGPMACEVEVRFSDALPRFERSRYDFVVLDIRGPHGKGDEEAGVAVFEEIKKRAFVPIVFYTAVPDAAKGIGAAFVRVVEKTEGLARLTAEFRAVYQTGLPEFRRHLDEEQRKYLWDFVAESWPLSGLSESGGALTYLLARRLAGVLARPSVRRFLADKGIPSGAADGTVEPVEMYVLPPVDAETPLAGDLVHGEAGGMAAWWVVLTPSCDFEQGKADHVLMARCTPLGEQKECAAFVSAVEAGKTPSRNVTKTLTALIADNRQKHQRDRFKFLPGVFDIPDFLVDFQQLVQVPEADSRALRRMASLDTPFAEALVNRFSRYYGRIGAPDLNTAAVLERIRAASAENDD